MAELSKERRLFWLNKRINDRIVLKKKEVKRYVELYKKAVKDGLMTSYFDGMRIQLLEEIAELKEKLI